MINEWVDSSFTGDKYSPRVVLRKDFLVDYVDDIEGLPTEGILTGSVAFCIEDAKKYILSNFRTWGPVGERPTEPVDPSEDGSMVVRGAYSTDTGTVILDKTWKEISDAITSGKYVVIYHDDPDDASFPLCITYMNPPSGEDALAAVARSGNGGRYLYCASENDYPYFYDD